MQLEWHCGCQRFVAEIKKALPSLEFGNKKLTNVIAYFGRNVRESQ
jgi:hypothetical protein